jgi:hypothetical protein
MMKKTLPDVCSNIIARSALLTKWRQTRFGFHVKGHGASVCMAADASQGFAGGQA